MWFTIGMVVGYLVGRGLMEPLVRYIWNFIVSRIEE